jgi:serine/threonine-protein phosphatase 6 regulatory subunit 3
LSLQFTSGSLFTNSNWFAFEDNTAVTDSSNSSIPSPAPSSDDLTEEKAMIGETSERTTEPNRNHDLEASLEGDEEEDDDDGPTIVLGNGPVEPPSVSESDKVELGDSPIDRPSPVETDAEQAGEDVLPLKDEKNDVEIMEKEVIMETPIAETGISELKKGMEMLVAETGTAEPKKVEIPAENVATEVKTEVDIPVAETGVNELKTEQSENVQN